MTPPLYKPDLDDVISDVEIRRKKIKNLYLRLYPPNGAVKVSAPMHIPLEEIHAFLESRSEWIKEKQKRIQAKQSITRPNNQYTDGELHAYNGLNYCLRVIEHNGPARVTLRDAEIELTVRPGTEVSKKAWCLERWYRQQLHILIRELIERYEPRMGVHVRQFGIKKMKTRWGSCNPVARRIWLNLELAQKSAQCIEYVVVHEMVHLLETSHNARFKSLMTQFLPQWKDCKKLLHTEVEKADSDYRC